MKVICINGSPRKNGNTATLLKEALNGAASENAETEFIDLIDLNFKGCYSCFACKRLGSESYGKCSFNDDLKPVLSKIEEADAVIFGSPVYFSSESALLRSLLERLFFQYLVYDKSYSSLAPKKINTALIFTMNVAEKDANKFGYDQVFNFIAGRLSHFFGSSQMLSSYNTYQFNDYSKYEASAFDLEEKTRQREIQFPIDKQKAFQLGADLANKSI